MSQMDPSKPLPDDAQMNRKTEDSGPSRSHPVWRWTKLVLGAILMALGLVGLFLPFLQGVLFLVLGFAVLSSESQRVKRLGDALRERYPGPWEQAEALKLRFLRWWRVKVGQCGEAVPSDEG